MDARSPSPISPRPTSLNVTSSYRSQLTAEETGAQRDEPFWLRSLSDVPERKSLAKRRLMGQRQLWLSSV